MANVRSASSPRRSRAPKSLAPPDLPADDNLSENLPPASDDPQQLSVFDKLRLMQPGAWEHHKVFLYRLEPRVRNSAGPKFIDTYRQPIDESDVKNSHGGGKYRVMVKDETTSTLVMQADFEIEGLPKFLAGQTLADTGQPVGAVAPLPAPAPAVSAVVPSDITQIVNAVIQALGDRSVAPDKAMANALDIMKQAQTASIEIMQQRATNETSGGNKMDKLLELAITRMMQPVDPMAQMTAMLTMMKTMRDVMTPASAPTGTGVAGELGALKGLFGGEGLVEILRNGLTGGGGGKEEGWKSTLANAAHELAKNAPALLDRAATMARLAQRPPVQQQRIALPAGQQQLGQPVAIAPAVDATVDVAAPGAQVIDISAGAQPPAPAPRDPADINEVLNHISTIVARSYTANDGGDMAASILWRVYPEHVLQFKDILGDVDRVMQYSREDAVLSVIAKNPDYQEFVKDFCTVIQDPNAEFDDDDDVPPSTRPPRGTQPAA